MTLRMTWCAHLCGGPRAGQGGAHGLPGRTTGQQVPAGGGSSRVRGPASGWGLSAGYQGLWLGLRFTGRLLLSPASSLLARPRVSRCAVPCVTWVGRGRRGPPGEEEAGEPCARSAGTVPRGDVAGRPAASELSCPIGLISCEKRMYGQGGRKVRTTDDGRQHQRSAAGVQGPGRTGRCGRGRWPSPCGRVSGWWGLREGRPAVGGAGGEGARGAGGLGEAEQAGGRASIWLRLTRRQEPERPGLLLASARGLTWSVRLDGWIRKQTRRGLGSPRGGPGCHLDDTESIAGPPAALGGGSLPRLPVRGAIAAPLMFPGHFGVREAADGC